MNTEQASVKQINFINTLIEDSNETALNVGKFLIDKGIDNLNKGQASYLINILKKYNKEMPTPKKMLTKQAESKDKNIETGCKEKPLRNYSGYGWEGVNYNRELTCKEIAQLLRKEFKKLFPKKKFSIRSTYNHLTVTLTKTDVTPFENASAIDWNDLYYRHALQFPSDSMEDFKRDYYQNYVNKGSMQVNQFHISSDWRLSQETKEMFLKVKSLLDSFNYDDSDSMTDYFSTNFYVSLNIGGYDKPLIITQ